MSRWLKTSSKDAGLVSNSLCCLPTALNPFELCQMKLSKLQKLQGKAEQCTTRKEAQKILKKASKLTYTQTIINE